MKWRAVSIDINGNKTVYTKHAKYVTGSVIKAKTGFIKND